MGLPDAPNPLNYPQVLLELVANQGKMQEQLAEVTAAISEFREERKADHFTRKDIILAVMGSAGSIAVLFAGLFFLINTQVEPIKAQLNTVERETAERFSQITETFGDRMKAQLELMQANRATNIEQDKEINDLRLQNAAQASRMDRNGSKP